MKEYNMTEEMAEHRRSVCFIEIKAHPLLHGCVAYVIGHVAAACIIRAPVSTVCNTIQQNIKTSNAWTGTLRAILLIGTNNNIHKQFTYTRI